MTKHYITPEEHARLQRRRGRQALGLLITLLVLVGFVTVLRAGVGLVANLFDDTAQKQEYEDKLEGLVLFDPMPFDGIENIDDLTLREAAVWGCIYNIQETQGGFDNYNTDPDTEQLLLPSVEVDAYLARLVGPSFKLTHRSFEMEDMTIEFDESSQCYKIPVTGTVGYYRAVVTKLFKRSGQLHVTVGYIPTSSTDDSIINQSSDTPTKYMDYLFERQSGSWYLTGLTESETKPDSTASTEAASQPQPMAESDVQDAILATAGSSEAASDAASDAAAEPDTQNLDEPAADSTAADNTRFVYHKSVIGFQYIDPESFKAFVNCRESVGLLYFKPLGTRYNGLAVICRGCCYGNYRNKVWNISRIDIYTVQITLFNGYVALLHGYFGSHFFENRKYLFIALNGRDVKPRYGDFARNGTCRQEECRI